MEQKVDSLYTEIMKVYPQATEGKRGAFIQWFVRNDMQFFIRTFLERNLSVSATARTLFLGESTVIFRIKRIKEFTGLNIRQFRGALRILTLLTKCELF